MRRSKTRYSSVGRQAPTCALMVLKKKVSPLAVGAQENRVFLRLNGRTCKYYQQQAGA